VAPEWIDLGEKNSPFLVIFTDLDGTLLDPITYSWQEAQQAIEKCKLYQIPIVPVTSKTRAELKSLMADIGINGPFITENGGGIFFPKTMFHNPPPESDSVDGLWRWTLGVSYETLKKALNEIAEEIGATLTGFSDMEPSQISTLTGLDLDQARRAAKREFDEPFVLPYMDETLELKIAEAAQKRGLLVSKGGRFLHLHGRSDKGSAVRRLIDWYRHTGHHNIHSLGIGDSQNDFPMLEAVDQAIFVGDPKKLNAWAGKPKRLMITKQKGPKGWHEGIMNFLNAQGGTQR